MSEMSRRSFVSLATLASAAVPLVGWSRLAAADTAAPPVREKVLINYNENPLGPSPKAVAAMQRLKTVLLRHGVQVDSVRVPGET